MSRVVLLISSGIIDFKGFFVESLKTRSVRIWHPFLRLIFVDWSVNIETKTHVLLFRFVVDKKSIFFIVLGYQGMFSRVACASNKINIL